MHIDAELQLSFRVGGSEVVSLRKALQHEVIKTVDEVTTPGDEADVRDLLNGLAVEGIRALQAYQDSLFE